MRSSQPPQPRSRIAIFIINFLYSATLFNLKTNALTKRHYVHEHTRDIEGKKVHVRTHVRGKGSNKLKTPGGLTLRNKSDYFAVWGSGYEMPMQKFVSANFFTEDLGYSEDEILDILALRTGETWHSKAPEVHFVTRISDDLD